MNQALKYEVLGIGNALVDIFAAVDEEIGPFLGLYPDRSVHVDYRRLSEIIVALPDPIIGAGGGAANTTKLAALLGSSSAFIGAVGTNPKGETDHFAKVFEQELEEAGVTTYLVKSPEPTGACAVIRMPGDSVTVAASPSAALSLQAGDITEELIRATRLIVLDGYMLGREALVTRVFTLAERYGTAIALDVGSQQLAAAHAHAIAEYCKSFPIILFMNQAEALAFCCSLNRIPSEEQTEQSCTDTKQEDVYETLVKLCSDDIFPIIVVKRGSKGSLVYANGSMHTIRTSAAVPFDTNGAGDAFAAGFISGWLRNRPLAECAALGNKAARMIIRVPGTNPDHERFKKIIKSLDK